MRLQTQRWIEVSQASQVPSRGAPHRKPRKTILNEATHTHTHTIFTHSLFLFNTRIVTGSEDSKVNVYTGPPFKFLMSNKKHTNFANCVRYSPDGNRFVSVSSDKKCILYQGDSGEVMTEFGTTAGEAHTGSIMSCAWSPDSTRLITAAADKTVKLWDMAQAAPKLVSTIKFGQQVEDMQVGCTWIGDYVLSISLSGHINYLDLGAGSVRTQVLGHTKSISTMTADCFNGKETFYTASYDGKLCEWDASSGCKGSAFAHKNMPVSMDLNGTGTSLASVGFDDKFCVTSLPLKGEQTSVKQTNLEAQPKSSSYSKQSDIVAICYEKKLELTKDGAQVCSVDLTQDASCCAISPDGTQVAVGLKSGKILLHSHKSGSLEQTKTLERHRQEVCVMSYSHDGSMLASGDSNRECLVWDATTGEVKKSRMVYHNSKITCLDWSPDNTKLCSGSVDSNIIVWDMALPTSKRQTLALSHQEGVRGVTFLSDSLLVSVGTDSCCKIWKKN